MPAARFVYPGCSAPQGFEDGGEEGIAVFDEGAVGQKAHGHPGDAVVVRHEAVLYGKCAHTMGRAGANSPGVFDFYDPNESSAAVV